MIFIYMIKLRELMESEGDDLTIIGSNSVNSSLVVTDSKTNERSNFVISNLTRQSLAIKVKMINGVYFVDIK
jgi:hypothetical protein